jgi:hypothetical protein
MSEASWQREAERLCERWLDVDSPPADGDVAPATSADEQIRRHVADQQLVDALLQSLANREFADTSSRVRRVMDAIAAESPSPATPNHRTARIWSLVGLAACLLIACTLLVMKSANESRATEILAEIRQVSLADTDRVYHVFHSNSQHDAPFEFLGKLYLRGTTGFVVQVNDFAFGRHSDEYWVVPPEGPVILANDFNWLNSPSTRDMLELELLKDLSVKSHRAPLMQLSTTVESIEGDYDFAVHQGTYDGTRRLDELSATRREADEELPASIRLWFDSETKIVHTVELTWSVVEGKPLRHSVRFTLAPAEHVVDKWYQHAAHHSADRPVRRADTEPAESAASAKE